MIHARHMARPDFQRTIIAQDDDNGYQESGYVACVDGDWAGLTSYSHCSCFDTFTALCARAIRPADRAAARLR